MRFILSAAGTAVLLGGVAVAEMPSTRITYNAKNYATPTTIQETVVKAPEPSIVEIKETTLLFAGDMMLSRGINNVMSKRNDFTYPFQKLQELTASADIFVVNLEGPISSRGENRGSIYSFRANPKAIEGLTFAGIDLVTLANNHSGDYGPVALSDTFELLQKAGIEVVGAGVDMKNAKDARFININGLKIAFLGATPLSPAWLTRPDSSPAVAPFDEQAIIKGITEAKENGADIVAVLPHWGNEYRTKHLASQEAVAHSFVDAGANLVIGHHPHVVQSVERYGGGVIAYSLGNFIFDQNFSPDTHNGLLLKIVLKGKEIASVQEIQIEFSSSYQPYIATSMVR